MSGVKEFLWALLGIVVFSAVLYAIATLVFGPGEPPLPSGEHPPRPLPEGRMLTSADVKNAELSVVARGYRMQEVDALLARLAEELHARDQLLRAPAAGDSDEIQSSPAQTADSSTSAESADDSTTQGSC